MVEPGDHVVEAGLLAGRNGVADVDAHRHAHDVFDVVVAGAHEIAVTPAARATSIADWSDFR